MIIVLLLVLLFKSDTSFKRQLPGYYYELGGSYLQLDQGYLITSVKPGSAFYKYDINPGDIILSIEGGELISQDQRFLLLTIDRNGVIFKIGIRNTYIKEEK